MSFQIPQDTHDNLIENLERSLKEMLQVKHGKRELRVLNLDMPKNVRKDELKEQKKAKINGVSYTKPVKATLELREDGKRLNKSTIKVLEIPQVTVRGTYIVGGNEYSFPLQKRLIPGVYTREHNDGTISAWLNSSKGRNLHVTLRPKNGDFVMEVESSKINLYALLKGLGVTDSQLRRAWGREVFDNNRTARGAKNPLKALKKLYTKLHYAGDDPAKSKDVPGYREWILNYFKNKSSYEGDNVKLTLGKNFKKTSIPLIIASTQKVLGISRGKEEEDNKESLIHNKVYDLSDFAIERLNQRQYQNRIKRTLKRNMKRYDKVSQIVQRDIFQTPLDSTFTQTNLAKIPKQNNPMDQEAAFSEITVMGEGGIQSGHAVTRDVRAIDPSHMGFIDPAHTPEGQNIGTTLHLASGVHKKGKTLTTSVYDVKTGKTKQITPREMHTSYVTFPEFYKNKKIKPGGDGLVKASYKGNVQRVKPNKVQYAMRVSTDMFGVNTMGVPFLSHNNGTRVMTAAKMQAQAKPLKYREKPLVQSAVSESDNRTVEDIVGKNNIPKAPVSGEVTKVDKDEITIKDSKGKEHTVGIPNKFWMNENNYTDTELTVKKGDKVKKGQPLGETNYTKDGTLALGVNLRTAYIPHKGYNHEDGVVISESAAEKMTSMHAYQKTCPLQDSETIDKKKFLAYFPAIFDQKQLKKIGKDGVIKKGQKVQKGDPLVLKMRKVEEDTLSKKLQNISRLLTQDYRDTSMTWDKKTTGVVEEVHHRRDDIMIVVQTEEQMKVGDKLVGRYGNKATVTSILPNKEMPHTEDGDHMELLIDPSSVPGRMNIGQIMETTASQIAEKEGKPYIAKPFGGDHTNKIMKELKKHGLKDHGTLVDGDDKIEGVLHGKQYIMKLEHQVDKKLSARGAGPEYAYSTSGQPARGGGESGRAVGLGELYALLSHGAEANLSEMYTFKGDKQLEAWRAIENGTMLPKPDMPASSERFVNMMRGMGIDLVEDKNMVKMVPFLDRDVKKVSNGKIKDATTLRAKDLKEEKGGLFDFKTTGGLVGDKWGHVDLAESMPHPTFEKSILAVTHLKKKELKDIMAGKKGVVNGKVVKADTTGAEVGGDAIRSLLKKIDVDSRLKEIKKIAPKKKGTPLNKLHREARVLKNFKENGIKLEEMVVDKLPIIPPKFRPITELPTGDIAVADVNEHYRSAILMNEHMKNFKDRPGLKEEANKSRKNLYEALSGTMGMSMGLVDKPDVKGLGKTIAGKTPKSGYYQSKLLKRRQDTSGTAVVSPEPKLDMDQIGIPENMAWDIFKPFVIKGLKSQGLSSMKAREEIENRSKFARDTLNNTMKDRMVMVNRAPTLHRWGFMAFKPKLVSGSAVKVPVEVEGGFNMDYDGDTVGIHVPTSKEAIEEAKNMLPSKNLYQPGSKRGKMAVGLQKEYMMGLYKLTRNGRTTTKRYKRPEMVLRDAKRKKIRWTDIVSVRRIGRTTAGKVRVNQKVPRKLRNYQITLNEDAQESFLNEIEKEAGADALKRVMNDWKQAGRIHVYTSGTSFLLSDLKMLTKERTKLYRQADQKALRVRRDKSLSEEEKEKKLIDIYSKVDSKIMGMAAKLPNNAAGKTNNITDMIQSGMSKPGPNQLKQLVGNLGLMLDHRQKVMSEPIRGNYSEGLSSSEFFSHMYAQRKGMIDKSQSVSGPGMLSKELTNTATTQKVTAVDCGTKNGRMEKVDRHLLDRVILSNTVGVQPNTVIDEDVLNKLEKAKAQKVKVRSILTCEQDAGICAKCFGLDEFGKFPPVGRNLGVSEIQALTERSVQLPMKSFHCLNRNVFLHVRTPDGKVLTPTHKDLFFMLSETPVTGTDWEEKYPVNTWEVLDKDGWTPIRKMGRHKKNNPMYAIKTQTGHLIVCQANHPIMVSDDAVICEECGQEKLAVHSQRDWGFCTSCQNCDHSQKVDRDRWLASQPYMVRADDVKDSHVVRILNDLPFFSEEGYEGTLDPYELGFFMSEVGHISAEKKMPADFLPNATKEQMGDMLSGLIDGDGCIANPSDAPKYIHIDSNSVAIVNQVKAICDHLGIWANTCLTTNREKTNYQGYVVKLYPTQEQCENYLFSSEKVKPGEFDRECRFESRHLTHASVVRAVHQEEDEWVYDLTTESGTFYAGQVWNHNTGGVATAESGLANAFDRALQIFRMPNNLRGKATLAEVNGVVSSIRKSGYGGHIVTVGQKEHKVPKSRKLKVKRGQKVKKGDPLSDGVVKPQELMKLKGVNAVQSQMRDDLHETFTSAGVKLDKRTYEVPVKMLTEQVRVLDPGDCDKFVAGDYSTLGKVQSWNKQNVGKEQIKYQNILPGALYAPQKTEDWARRMALGRIKKTLSEGAGMGFKSPRKDTSDFAQLALGPNTKIKKPGEQ